ncbi:MAG: rhomboid family intramembrane serine protease [Phycisphaerales bacterium]|nr:rhomboid family intramembrane serine protease [Phycisphaerales bacterium]
MIPLGTDQVRSRFPFVTLTILLACAALYLYDSTSQLNNPDAKPWSFDFWVSQTSPWYTFLTTAFFHADLLHLASNMVILIALGSALESRLGHISYSVLYLLGAVAASFAHILTTSDPALGASGAVAAVCACFMVIMPRTRIRTLMFYGLISIIELPAWFYVGLFIILDILHATTGWGGNIAYTAHLGGAALGILFGFIGIATGLITRDHTDLLSAIHRARRRAEFKALTRDVERQTAQRAALASSTPIADPQLAELRSSISALVAQDKLDQAAESYIELLKRYPEPSRTRVLSAKAQLAVANQLYLTQRYAHAIDAYEGYAELYTTEPDEPRVRVLIATIAMRQLNDPSRAQRALKAIRRELSDPQQHALAAQLAEEVRTALAATKAAAEAAPSPTPPQSPR